jgi:hypothetical protein
MPTSVRLTEPHRRPISSEEAAAVVAALESFMRATIPPLAAPVEPLDGWHRAATLEGVSRGTHGDPPDPWLRAA